MKKKNQEERNKMTIKEMNYQLNQETAMKKMREKINGLEEAARKGVVLNFLSDALECESEIKIAEKYLEKSKIDGYKKQVVNIFNKKNLGNPWRYE